jgi:hypothetical protein
LYSLALEILDIMLYKARASPFVVPSGKPSDFYWTVHTQVASRLDR